MTIQVSKDAENTINAAVSSGQFASADEMVDKLVRDYARRHPVRPSSQPVEAKGNPNLGSIGAMRDSAAELDEIVADAYRQRREESWRDLDL
jgi:Arc/MetJ-type ribon-helix-helix transcriptional regulator